MTGTLALTTFELIIIDAHRIILERPSVFKGASLLGCEGCRGLSRVSESARSVPRLCACQTEAEKLTTTTTTTGRRCLPFACSSSLSLSSTRTSAGRKTPSFPARRSYQVTACPARSEKFLSDNRRGLRRGVPPLSAIVSDPEHPRLGPPPRPLALSSSVRAEHHPNRP